MGRTPCCDKVGLKKGPWTPEEDQKLIDYIHKHGPGNWRALPKKAGLERCGKSCRLRWTNYLRPDIKRGRFSFEEEETIIQLHSILGNKWSAIAAKLPGRTDNEIKNYWNTHIRKRLVRMGLNPVTHGPRLDFLDLPSILSSLQNPSLLNIPALQTLLNPELIRLFASLDSSQNGLSKNSTDYPIDPNFQIANQFEHPIQNIPSFNGTQMNPNFNCHNFNCYGPDHETLYPLSDNSAFISSNSNVGFNSNNFSRVFSTPCSSPVDPLDSSPYLNSRTSCEDEIESYLECL